MSLIFGANLSDRIYLAADTRLTKTVSGDSKDDILKIENIHNNLLVAAAGDLALAQYLFKKLKADPIPKLPIDQFRAGIEGWIKQTINKYLESHHYAKSCLLFAGIDPDKRKIISGKQLIKKVKHFQDTTGTQMELKPVIYEGLKAKGNNPNPYPELPVPHSRLFGVQISPKENLLKIEDTDWGEYLAYGPKGFSKEDVPSTLIGQLEFEKGCGNVIRETGVLAAFIFSTAATKELPTVGGGVITLMVGTLPNSVPGTFMGSNKTYISRTGDPKDLELVQEVEVIDNKFCYRKNNSNFIALTPFSEYKPHKGQSMI